MADRAPRPGPAAGRTAPGARPPATPRGTGSIGLRLALTFAAVALTAVALLAGLTAAFAAADVSQLASRQGAELTRAISVAAGAEWDRNRSWSGADLGPVLDLAGRVGADVQVRDRAGRVVASSPGYGTRAVRRSFRAAVTVHGQQVGMTETRFAGTGLEGAGQALQAALRRAIAGAAGLAALLALLAGLVVARHITRPLDRLIAVAQAMGGGDRAARAGPIRAPRELSELASAFDQMADTLASQEQLRRGLVADVAHELRTPIAVLQAGHEALLDGVAEPTPGQLASLLEEVLRLARMVGDLQTLAAADAAALQLELTRCDLAQLARAAADGLASRFEAAGITVQQRLTPVGVMADPGRLHQVITNLLTNALKFTPAGGRVTVTAGPAGDQARLQVADTGRGIPADELPRIFDRFWRGRQAADVTGSGIGLAVAAELASAHRGQLAASSQPGRGTQLTLTLPRA